MRPPLAMSFAVIQSLNIAIPSPSSAARLITEALDTGIVFVNATFCSETPFERNRQECRYWGS